MPTTNWRSEVQLTADVHAAEPSAAGEERGDNRPCVIVVLGDFRGAADDGPPGQTGPLVNRRLLDIDRDNFDDVLARFDVHWEATLEGLPGQPAGALPVRLALQALEDFHPDQLVAQLMPLRALVDMRRGLEDPAHFETVAAEVLQWAQQPLADVPPRPLVESSGLLERILAQSNTRTEQTFREPQSGDLQRFLENAVRPYLVKIDTDRQTRLIEAVDQALAQQVRSVLHHPGFQRLEAAWRSVYWLVNRAETGTHLKIRMVHMTKDEIQQDLAASPVLEESRLARLLLEPASVPGGQPATLIIGNYEFAHTREDLALLEHLGGIAQQLRAPFVAAASPRLLGCASFTEIDSANDVVRRLQEPSYQEWHALRRSPVARWLALGLPRLLLRLPYGAATEPADTFMFEEHISGSDHEQLLWGNPAFAVGAVVAGAFAVAGWSLEVSEWGQRLEGFPLYIYHEEGVAVAKPCAEVLLSERVVTALEEAGLVPLVSYRDTDTVALPCLQSLGEPRSLLQWR
jgi:type VI secretion system protein ImpC